MCGHTPDVVIYSKFHRNPFRGLGAPGGRNLPVPITLAIGFYNSLHYRASRDTKQSLALRLMAIYTLKPNILVYFSHLNYLFVLSRSNRYTSTRKTALNSYRFIHQSSPFKFAIRLTFSLRFASNCFSAHHQN